jgi:hydrogenase nickel incorporation protein HypA/HybF
MHELSIARSLIDLASEYAEQQEATKIEEIYVRLGVLSGMLRPLHFCFVSAAKGTACEGASLDIEEVPITVRCPRCDETKAPVNRYSLRCPDCFETSLKIVTGREMQLVGIKVKTDRDVEAKQKSNLAK